MRTTAFVGRADEYRGLIVQLSRPGTLALVLGEAGMGKTRLIGEVVEGLRHPTLIGRCWRGGSSTPYLPWMQLATGAGSILDPDDADFGSRFDDIAFLFPRRGSRHRFAADDTTRHLIALGMVDYLRCLAETVGGMLSIVIEDVHTADPHSLELIRRISGQNLPLSMVATSRPFAEAATSIEGELDALFAESEMLALLPLGRVAVAELMADHGIGEEWVENAILSTAGVPLLLHSWMAERDLHAVGPGRPGIEMRLARLSDGALDTLRYAALIGVEFDCLTLSRATGATPEVCLGSLGEARGVGLVDSDPDMVGVFHFHHETFRETIAENIPLVERAERHRTLLDVFLALRGTAGQRELSELADHAAHAAFVGDAELAVALNMEAGEDALERVAPMVAHRHFRRAVELAERAGSPTKLLLTAELGSLRALKATGRSDTRDGLLSLLGRCGADPELGDVMVDAVIGLTTSSAGMGVAPDVQPVIRTWVARALDRVGTEATPRRVRLLVEQALQSRDRGGDESRSLFDEAAATAAEIGDPQLRAYVYAADHGIHRSAGEGPEVLQGITELERDIRPTDHDSRQWLSSLKTVNWLRMGQPTAARAEVDALERGLAPLPPVVVWLTRRFRTLFRFVRGDIAGAQESALAAYETVKGGHHDSLASEYVQIQLGPIYRLRAEPEMIEPMLAGLHERRPEFPGYRAAYSWVLADCGRQEEARAHLAALFGSDLTDSGLVDWLPTVSLAAGAAATLGEAGMCHRFVELLEPHRKDWIVHGSGLAVHGPVCLTRAWAALVAGDLEVARRDLVMAREEVLRSGALVFEPELLHHEALLAEAEGDAAEAVARMTEASEAAGGMELEKLAGALAARAYEMAEREQEDTGPLSSGSPAAVILSGSGPGIRGVFTRRGATWRVGLGEESVDVAHVKGMVAIATLLGSPGREFSATQLAAIVDGAGRAPDTYGVEEAGLGRHELVDVLVDRTALADYRRRIRELEDEVDEAERFNDPRRREVARSELDQLLDHLVRSTGFGGRSRTATSTSERARVRITKSIRTAIARISEGTPVLGRHLQSTIVTGRFCRYRPDLLTEIDWELGSD